MTKAQLKEQLSVSREMAEEYSAAADRLRSHAMKLLNWPDHPVKIVLPSGRTVPFAAAPPNAKTEALSILEQAEGYREDAKWWSETGAQLAKLAAGRGLS